MSMFHKIFAFVGKFFTWWNGATISTSVATLFNFEHVGTDFEGNKYYRARRKRAGFERRWVIYQGANDASRVPAEWHGWLHHVYDLMPENRLPPKLAWEADYTPNETGTDKAYHPAGSLAKGGVRAKAVGDYRPWTPEA